MPPLRQARTGGRAGTGGIPINRLANAAQAFEGTCGLERKAYSDLELAVLVVGSAKGAVAVYDPVEMVFDPRFNLVDHLRAPARVAPAIAGSAKSLALRVAEAFAMPGLYAVVLFLTKDGELLVNETAPRAHNSGHHTIEACASSQFDQLLRAYMGWPLGDATLRGHTAMITLVGEGGTGSVE